MAHVLAKDLREAVLQSALEGKITETLSLDTSPFENIKQFKKEKEYLLQKKNMKERNQFNPIKEEELTFKIPDTWQWIRINDIGIYKKGPFGSALTKGMFVPKSKDSVKVYEQKNAIQKNWKLGNYYIKRDYYETKMSGFSVETGDIIVSCAGTIGETYILPEGIETGIINQALMRMNIVPSLNIDYFMLVFDHILKEEAKKNSGGTAIKNIPPFEVFKAMPIPLPPIEEQARIVARVDELMAKIDEYEKLENELVELKKNFPGDMKAAVLQAAIQGKLTEQKSTEFISKVDREVISDEYDTFDIPDNWQWNTINSVMNITTGLTFNKLDQRPAGPNTLRVLRGGNILDNFNYGLFENDVYVTYRDKHIPLLKDDVITPAVTSMEKMCKVGYIEKNLPNTTAGGFVYILRTKDAEVLDPRYMMYFFNSAFNRNNCNVNIHKSGQAFYNLKKSGMVNQPIPLPPIEEQRRIVEKLDKLLPLCEELEKKVV